MAIFKVEGGRRLRGEITPQGAKNEALQILCATLLTQEKVIVHNVPQILDVIQLIKLLQAMGVEVERLSEESYSFRAADIDPDYLRSDDYCRRASRLRGSVMLLGPMLARFGVGYMPKPGGDKIGRRRLDTHFIGFQKLGATLDFDTAAACSEVRCKELKGCYMLLDEASVTGTANIIMAAVMAKGFTTIYNAACEPYIQQLCLMLNRMGARISGIASNLLTIEGVRELHGTEHTLLPDMIEVGSFIGLAAMTRPVRPPGHPLRTARRRHLHSPTGALPHRELHRRLDHDHRRRTLAGPHARPAVGIPRGGHPSQRLGADSPEDVRKPPVFRR